MKLFHIMCESVKKTQLFHINEHQTMESPLLFTFSRRFRHMYIILIYTYVALTLRFCRPEALFIIAMRPCYYRSWRLSSRREMCVEGFYLPAFSMRTCACRWRAHVVNQWRQREQNECSARARARKQKENAQMLSFIR